MRSTRQNEREKMRKPKPTQLESQISLTFEHYKRLQEIVCDLENIDRLVPGEASRSNAFMDRRTMAEEICIIEHRKQNLLKYIQTICRDHIAWSKPLLDAGWKAKRKHVRR